MTSHSISKLSDDETLALAGNLGPAIIGQELFDRATEVRARTSGGLFGPAIVGKKAEPDEPAWDGWTRAELLKHARELELPDIKSNTTRDALVAALTAAGHTPPKA